MSNYHGCKREAINLISHYMIDIICKNVKPSRLEKQIVKKRKENFDKVNRNFLHLLLLLKETDFQKLGEREHE